MNLDTSSTQIAVPRQITHGPGGRILTNTRVWSPDGQWIVYDTRSDPAGDRFDGDRIEIVHVRTGEVRTLFRSRNGAHCGVATFHPSKPKVAFILGPEDPTPDWQYCAWHRQGVVVDARQPGLTENLDARDILPPFTPGALRGGSHVHVWDGAGEMISFTYEDHVLAETAAETPAAEMNLRNIGVSIPDRLVQPRSEHPRNHSGTHFTVLVTRTVAHPEPGSDEISRAFEEAWVGTNGYRRLDGTLQRRALAFQGHVRVRPKVHGLSSVSGSPAGQGSHTLSEVFIVDLPADLTIPGDGPLQGTPTRRPFPPKGTSQRRLTFTADREHPGIQGPRHWLRSSPNGDRIGFLMPDDSGIVQLWTVSPNGGAPRQLTSNPWPIASAFDWNSDGSAIAHVMDGSVCMTDSRAGSTRRLTARQQGPAAPRPEACVFSPDGTCIAYVAQVDSHNQIFVVSLSLAAVSANCSPVGAR